MYLPGFHHFLVLYVLRVFVSIYQYVLKICSPSLLLLDFCLDNEVLGKDVCGGSTSSSDQTIAYAHSAGVFLRHV